MTFSVEIPVPPSVNAAFFNRAAGSGGRGRGKTKAYRDWLATAGWKVKAEVSAAERVSGPFRISINLPATMNGDIDNRVKGIVDLLVACDRVDDDRNLEELIVRRRHDGPLALIHVKPAIFPKARVA